MIVEPVILNEAQCELEVREEAFGGEVQWRTLLSGDRTHTDSLTLGVVDIHTRLGGRPRLHRHAQPEAYYVLSVRGTICIGGAERDLSPGDTAFIPGLAWHGAWCVGGETLRILYVFAADSFADVEYEFAEGD